MKKLTFLKSVSLSLAITFIGMTIANAQTAQVPQLASPNDPDAVLVGVNGQPPQSQSVGKYHFVRSLQVGSTGNDVKQLQIFLNSHGFVVAASGTGSLGRESTYFGPATKKALIKFQNSYAADILLPNGLSQGSGYFGPATMRKINTL